VRVWNQEGYEEHVIITVPKVEKIDYTKGLNQRMIQDKTKQFSQIVDTRGWSAKGVTATSTGLAGDQRILSNDDMESLRTSSGGITNTAQVQDLQDEDSNIAGNVNNLMANHRVAIADNLQLTVEEARKEVLANEATNPITGSSNNQPSVYKNINPGIANLANNDLLPVSEIAKKAQTLQNESEVEIKLN
jgi:hypothetical protein